MLQERSTAAVGGERGGVSRAIVMEEIVVMCDVWWREMGVVTL